jgi:hypothetical protein
MLVLPFQNLKQICPDFEWFCYWTFTVYGAVSQMKNVLNILNIQFCSWLTTPHLVRSPSHCMEISLDGINFLKIL